MASDGKWYPPETWTGPPRQGVPAPNPAEPYPQHGATLVAARPTNGLAVAALVCACVGVIPFLFGVPCILGVIFGFVARNQINKSGGHQQGGGMALAGIIVGFSLIGIFIILVSLAAAFGGFHACTGFNNNCMMN